MNKIKINYGMIMILSETLNRMSALTGKLGFAIARTKKSVAPEVEVLTELRNAMVKKYGKEEDGVYSIKPDNENWTTFTKEYTDLLTQEIELDVYQVKAEDYDPDQAYCETATADDYGVFEEFMVEKKVSENDGESEPV